VKTVNSVLDACRNMLDNNIDNEIRERILNFILEPKPDTWSDISGIYINSSKTIWQSMCDYYPDFPRSGRRYDLEGNVIKEWEKIPTPFELMNAIKNEVMPDRKFKILR